jgi:4-amino-4-deoxy-L-arabinose transferase-like glycosyltransferase
VWAALAFILLLAFGLRVWGLEWHVRFLYDELHVSDGIRNLWWSPDAPILTGMSGLSPFTKLYVVWGMWLADMLEPSLMSLRLTSVVLGMLGVAATYGLARALFDRTTALLAALLLAVLPPHLFLSRLALPQMGDPVFGVLGLMFFARGLRHNRRLDWSLGGAMLGLSQYFYEAGRLLYPALLVGWLVLMAAFVPGRLKTHLRGLLVFALALLCLTVPLYVTLATTNESLTGRLDASGIGIEYFRDLLNDGLTWGEIVEQIERVTRPLVYYVSTPPYSIQPAFAPGAAAALFIVGLALFIPRWRTPAVLLPLWLVATSLGNSLMHDSTSHFRFGVVMSAVAIVMAVGLVGLASLLPRWGSLPLRRSASAAAAAAVALGLAVYHFGPSLAYLNLHGRPVPPYRDATDAALRAADLPLATEIYLISTPPVDAAVPSGFLSFLTRGGRGLASATPADVPVEGLPRDHPYAFFVAPTERAFMDRLRAAFPDLQPPVYSTYSQMAADEEYILLYLPPQG